ncbi:hypothetical protein ACFE04_005128 [Oxalis oulophora]
MDTWTNIKMIFDEIEVAKIKYGRLNKIVMNVVMEACVRCRDVDLAVKVFHDMSQPDSCGVDTVTYGILLKKHPSYSRVYIDFKRAEDVIDFADFFNDQLFVNEKGTQFKTVVEYAPSQHVPKQWSKKDGREGRATFEYQLGSRNIQMP